MTSAKRHFICDPSESQREKKRERGEEEEEVHAHQITRIRGFYHKATR